MKPLKTENLRNQALDALMMEVRGMHPGGNRLPSEEELARELQISRTTIREVMQLLAARGYITRRHGKGNFAHPSVTEIQRRIDLSSDFLQLLGASGQPTDCVVLRGGFTPPSEAMKQRFPLPCTRCYEQVWLYRAGGKPMILCKNYVPEALLPQQPKPAQPPLRLVNWLADNCHRDPAFYAVKMGCRADDDASRAFEYPAATVLPNWQELVYDISDEPIAFCDLFFHPEDADISMVLRF